MSIAIVNPARFIGRWKYFKPSLIQVCLQSGSASKPSIDMQHEVTEREKKHLVALGKYKSVDEVPKYVSHAALLKGKDKARIRYANWMILATILGCMSMVYLGKKEAAAGASVENQNEQWHKEVKAEYEKSQKK